MSGLPGVGKSTVAEQVSRTTGWPVFSVDPIESGILRSGIPASFETGLAAYVVADVLARENLSLGHSVIVDAVNAVEPGRAMWRSAAHATGARLRILECVCPDVAEHQRRVAVRRRGLVGFETLSWDRVEQVRAEFEPWTEERLVVDTSKEPDWPALIAFVRS